jgi:predicted dehydrogenase
MKMTRRFFLQNAATVGVAAAFPSIVPARVLGKDAPSNMVNVAQIGCGRIGLTMDVPGFLRARGARVVAACDLDSRRLEFMRGFIARKQGEKSGAAIFGARDFHDVISRADVDAVAISTPDHWHAQIAIEAAFAGKHVYMQKPASLTIREGRLFADAIAETGRTFLLGSQQRSWAHFQKACAFVREGRIGKIKSIEVGLPGDPGGGSTNEMPVPECLDYDFWLGSTPKAFYTEDRVHSQNADLKKAINSRPGWLRCEQFGAGMITGWGSHHLDIMHWAMGWEKIGPKFIEGKGKFHTGGLWDVHGEYDIALTYPDGTSARVWDKFPNGVRFVGEKGWIFVSRGSAKISASDPVAGGKPLKALDASDPALIAGEPSVVLYPRLVKDPAFHHQNFIDSIKAGEPSVVPAETAHRSCSACLLSWIGMKLGRRLEWDWRKERFVDDAEADAMLERTERAPYGAKRAYERLSKKVVGTSNV